MFLIGVGLTGNTWKWLQIVGRGCMGAVNFSNWLKNHWKWLKIADNELENDGKGKKLLEMTWPENVMLNTTVMCRAM